MSETISVIVRVLLKNTHTQNLIGWSRDGDDGQTTKCGFPGINISVVVALLLKRESLTEETTLCTCKGRH